MAITADEAKRYAAVAGDALTAERVALRRAEAERDEARAGRENWREACRKAEAEGRSAGDTLEAAVKREMARAERAEAELDAALAQVKVLRQAAETAETWLVDLKSPATEFVLKALRAALSAHPAPAIYTREANEGAADCENCWHIHPRGTPCALPAAKETHRGGRCEKYVCAWCPPGEVKP